MPYIAQKDRLAFDKGKETIDKAGELNYLITQLVATYLEDKQLSYVELNACVGVLECAKLEFYARLVSKYEIKARLK